MPCVVCKLFGMERRMTRGEVYLIFTDDTVIMMSILYDYHLSDVIIVPGVMLKEAEGAGQ